MLWLLVLSATALAGCAESSGDEGIDNGPEIEVTETTGGIRGVVVDQAIVPVKGATVVIEGLGVSTETDESGLFLFDGLEAGTYFLTASHPFYDVVQQSATVDAGVARPPAVRIQMTRLITETPYISQLSFSGYISCSLNTIAFYSEECGEGVGVPRDSCFLVTHPGGCVANPVMPGQRVLQNPSNKAGQEFYMDSTLARSITIEQVWEPSLEVSSSGGGKFRTSYHINYVCDPLCGADYGFGNVVSNSPLKAYVTPEELTASNYTTESRFTTFTYAADEVGVLLEQSYEMFITIGYVLPVGEEYSLVNGDDKPF